MNIKFPAFYDISHWKEVLDFSKVSPRPLLFGTKATEATTFIDGKFARFFRGMADIGVRRLCYHFHRKAYNPTLQAQHFVNTIRPHITDADILALDVEEGGETASQLQAWCEYVQNALPHNRLLIYSRKNLLDPIPMFMRSLFPALEGMGVSSPLNAIQMTTAQRDFFKQIPTWIAGYPANPDVYNSVPAFYIPDQAKWGEVWAWQYSSTGVVTGISGSVDLNWLAPVFQALLGSIPPPTPADTTSYPFEGVTRISGIRYGWKFELFITEPSKVRYEAVCTPLLEKVSNVAKRKGAQIAGNGGDWEDYTALYDYAVSNGVICHPRAAARPSLMVLNDGHVVIDHKTAVSVKQALTGVGYLIGINAPPLTGTEARYTEGHARSIHGLDPNGKHLWLVSEGKYPNQGLKLWQAREILQQYGAVIAFDSGGGGDAEIVMNDILLTTTENIDANGNHFERPLPQTLLIYAQPIGDNDMATAISTTHNLSLRPLHQTINSSTLATIPKNTRLTVLDGWQAPETTSLNNQDDKWVKVIYGGITGWIGLVHLGVTYGTTDFVFNVPPPPTNEKKITKINIELAAGSIVTTTYSDGSTETKTA